MSLEFCNDDFPDLAGDIINVIGLLVISWFVIVPELVGEIVDDVSEVEDVEPTSLREVMRLRFGCLIVEEIASERTSFLSTWAAWLDFSFAAGVEERENAVDAKG